MDTNNNDAIVRGVGLPSGQSLAVTIRRAALLFPLAFALQACTNLGPDYQEPDVQWVEEWETNLYGQVHSAAGDTDDLRFWWQAFGDPVLNQLIDTARRENPTAPGPALTAGPRKGKTQGTIPT